MWFLFDNPLAFYRAIPKRNIVMKTVMNKSPGSYRTICRDPITPIIGEVINQLGWETIRKYS